VTAAASKNVIHQKLSPLVKMEIFSYKLLTSTVANYGYNRETSLLINEGFRLQLAPDPTIIINWSYISPTPPNVP
jgi:hypothetical protein